MFILSFIFLLLLFSCKVNSVKAAKTKNSSMPLELANDSIEEEKAAEKVTEKIEEKVVERVATKEEFITHLEGWNNHFQDNDIDQFVNMLLSNPSLLDENYDEAITWEEEEGRRDNNLLHLIFRIGVKRLFDRLKSSQQLLNTTPNIAEKIEAMLNSSNSKGLYPYDMAIYHMHPRVVSEVIEDRDISISWENKKSSWSDRGKYSRIFSKLLTTEGREAEIIAIFEELEGIQIKVDGEMVSVIEHFSNSASSSFLKLAIENRLIKVAEYLIKHNIALPYLSLLSDYLNSGADRDEEAFHLYTLLDREDSFLLERDKKQATSDGIKKVILKKAIQQNMHILTNYMFATDVYKLFVTLEEIKTLKNNIRKYTSEERANVLLDMVDRSLQELKANNKLRLK